MSEGHIAHGPKDALTGSPNVFVNGIPVQRVGDVWREPHYTELNTGSFTVFVNGKGMGRVGDTLACGDSVATGSNDVFCG